MESTEAIISKIDVSGNTLLSKAFKEMLEFVEHCAELETEHVLECDEPFAAREACRLLNKWNVDDKIIFTILENKC